MISIPFLCERLRTLFEEEAPRLGRQCGLRERTIPLRLLAYLLVFGWWTHPHEGPSALARFGGELELTLSKQAVDAHLTERTASWLLALLERAVQRLVCAQAVGIALLQRFAAVLIEDGSTISLPSALAPIWRGCGGNTGHGEQRKDPKTEAALKLTLRWDLLRGGLDGPHLQAGRSHEVRSVLADHPIPRGSLICVDLGYWALARLVGWMKAGVYFLMRYKVGTVLWYQGQRVDVHRLLPSEPNATAEDVVDLGAHRQVRGVRLLIQCVPDHVVEHRHERIREEARVQQRPVNPLLLEMARWTLLISNVPAQTATLAELFALQHARWQVELLFKLGKQETLLDEWNGEKPLRVLCELYAKLLAVLIQHWVLLLTSWEDPDRSWQAVAQVVRDHLPLLVHGLVGHLPLSRALRLLLQSVRGQCSVAPRARRPGTSRLLQGALAPGLT